MKQKNTIQKEILEILYLNNKNLDVKYICSSLGLKPSQVYEGLRHLHRRCLINKELVKTKKGYAEPPLKLFAESKKDKHTSKKIRRILSRMIKNERNTYQN